MPESRRFDHKLAVSSSRRFQYRRLNFLSARYANLDIAEELPPNVPRWSGSLTERGGRPEKIFCKSRARRRRPYFQITRNLGNSIGTVRAYSAYLAPKLRTIIASSSFA